MRGKLWLKAELICVKKYEGKIMVEGRINMYKEI
jgi:hypothetical protein